MPTPPHLPWSLGLRLFHGLGVLLLVGWSVGCARPDTATVGGTLQASGCDALQSSTAWQLQANYMTLLFQGLHTEPAVAELRIQAFPGSPTHPNAAAQDLLLVEIHNPLKVQVNQAIPVVAFTPRLSAQTPSNEPNVPSARANLMLGKTCPNQLQPFLLAGQLTFTQFGVQRGDAIAGSLTLQLSPARPTHPNNQGSLTGSFAFPLLPPLELGHDWVGYQPPTSGSP